MWKALPRMNAIRTSLCRGDAMIAIIFEVEPHADRRDAYFDLAATLKQDLQQIEGFISVERFRSLTDENKYLSLSFFTDEDAIVQWRNLQKHRNAQTAGRQEIFSNYRLRVASVIRDYGMFDREQAPEDSKASID